MRDWFIRIVSAAILLAVLYFCLFPEPQVRIDSGDRRSGLLYGPHQRTVVGRAYLVAAAAELGIPAEWHRLRGPPSNAEAFRGIAYTKTAYWLQAEPALGKRIFAGLASYYRGESAFERPSPWYEFTRVISYNEVTGTFEIDLDKMGDASRVQAMLDAIGYSPDPNGPLIQKLNRLR